MPIADDTTPNVVRLSITVSETGTDAFVGFDVPPPIPAGTGTSEAAVRAFYQKLINALAASPDFYGVTGQLVTEQRATATPDA